MDLNLEIQRARKEILSRMAVVNASLELAPFSRLAEGESHLKIEVKNVQSQDITDFRNELSGLLQGAWDDLSSIEAEARFSQIKKLVERLDPTNSNPEVQRWRKLVLDVRQHVEFTAYELDEAGNVIETYLSGSGKSGGQRQFVPVLARAAAAVGVAGFFMETHPTPSTAKSDGPNLVPLSEMKTLLSTLVEIDRVVKARPFLENTICDAAR